MRLHLAVARCHLKSITGLSKGRRRSQVFSFGDDGMCLWRISVKLLHPPVYHLADPFSMNRQLCRMQGRYRSQHTPPQWLRHRMQGAKSVLVCSR